MATYPAIVANDDSKAHFDSTVALHGIRGVGCGIDPYLWRYKTVIANQDFGHIEYNASEISVKIVADMNIMAIVAVKRGLYIRVLAAAAQKRLQNGGALV